MKALIALSACLLLFAACKDDVYVDPVYDPASFEPAFEAEKSHIPFPLFVSYIELEKLINNAMPVVLINDPSYDKGKIKNAKVRILRTGPVTLKSRNERLHIRVPLKADVRPKMTKKVLGVDMQVAPKVKAAFYLNLTTSVDFNAKYQILTDFKVESIDWIDDPTVRVIFWDLPITELVDSLLNGQNLKIETQLNKIVTQGVNIRKPVQKVWNDMQKPIRINKQLEEVYLLNSPFGLNLGGIALTETGIIADLELLTYASTGFQTDTSHIDITPLPELVKVDSTSNNFEINFFVYVPLAKASKIIQDQIANKRIEVTGTSLNIKHIKLHTSPDRLLLTTHITEPTTTHLLFESVVVFNPADTSIRAADFDFILTKGNTFVETAEVVVHPLVLETVGDKLKLPLGSLIGEIGPLVEGAIEKGQIGKSISLGLDDVMIQPTKIVLRPDTILMNVRGAGKVSLQILDFKPDKSKNLK